MKKNLTTMMAALLALALLASACGGSSDDQALIDAIAAQSRDDGMPAGMDVDCIAEAMVKGLGGAQVMEERYGLTAETVAAGESPDDVELSVDDARSMASDMLDCGFDDLMVSTIAGEGLSEDDVSCVLDKIDQDALRDLFAAEFMAEADADRIGEAAEDALEPAIKTLSEECGIGA